MTRYILPLVLLSFLLVPAAQAQQGGSAFIEQVQERAQGDVSESQALRMLNDTFFTPALAARGANGFGLDADGNTAIVRQFGSDNEATVEQRGQRNLAYVFQQGSGNVTRAMQDGSNNIQLSSLTGSDNTLEMTQQGNQNFYLMDFQGANLDHSVLQQGDNNVAVQIGRGAMPFGIEQRGNDMGIEIRHNQ